MNNFNSSKIGKRIFVLALSMILTISLVIPIMSTSVFASAEELDTTEKNQTSTVEVVSYLDIFENYYEIVVNELKENDIEMPVSFEQFCEGYYSHEYDIAVLPVW